MDFAVIINNARFLILQGFLGLGNFTGGTLRLASLPSSSAFFWVFSLAWAVWPVRVGFMSQQRYTSSFFAACLW